jgi:hypothetical protein
VENPRETCFHCVETFPLPSRLLSCHSWLSALHRYDHRLFHGTYGPNLAATQRTTWLAPFFKPIKNGDKEFVSRLIAVYVPASDGEPGAQIDLVLDRADGIVEL